MMRLDRALVLRGLCRSRGEAQAQIDAGKVLVSGVAATKSSQMVEDDSVLAATGDPPRYVSRGGLKLEAAIQDFQIAVEGRQALDVGAGTGGFTDCLLQHGAASVVAVDVGHGQMGADLAADPRVTLREGINARAMQPSDFPCRFEIITADLSFISLTLVLPALAPLLAAEGDLICLIKPQFEVGAGNLGKGGIVRNATARAAVLQRVTISAAACGLRQSGCIPSPIAGGDGNIEFLVRFKLEAGSDAKDGD